MPPQPAGPDEQDLMQVAQAMVRNRTAAEARLRAGKLARPVEWRLEGPFDSSYSLAVVNRALARALAAEGENVSLLSAEDPASFAAGRGLPGGPIGSRRAARALLHA